METGSNFSRSHNCQTVNHHHEVRNKFMIISVFSHNYLLACSNHALSALPPNQGLMISIMCFVVDLISSLTCKKNDFPVLRVVGYDDLGMKRAPSPVHLRDSHHKRLVASQRHQLQGSVTSGDLTGQSMSPEERPCYGAPCSLLVVTCRQFLPRVPTALMIRVTPDIETPSQVTRAELSKAANQDKSFLRQVDSIRNCPSEAKRYSR